LLLVCLDYPAVIVGGTIITHDHFQLEIALLRQDGFQALRDVILVIVGGDEYGYFHEDSLQVWIDKLSKRIVPEKSFCAGCILYSAVAIPISDQVTE
jgi:hypothetical protein